MKSKIRQTTMSISYVVAGLFSAAIISHAHAENISVSCTGAKSYDEGPNGTASCTIFNPFQNVLNIPNVKGAPAVALTIVNNGSIDSGDLARDPTLAAVPACFAKIPARTIVNKATVDGECSFDVTFATDEKVAPKKEAENFDSGSWLLTATVLATSPRLGDKTASGQFNIVVKDTPEPSSLFLCGLGVLLIGISRRYFSRVTSTLPNFSSAGPICLASPTTTIAD